MKVRDLRVGDVIDGKMPGDKKPKRRVVTTVLRRSSVIKFRTVHEDDLRASVRASREHKASIRCFPDGGEIWELPGWMRVAHL